MIYYLEEAYGQSTMLDYLRAVSTIIRGYDSQANTSSSQ
jgi:hypothetical protein